MKKKKSEELDRIMKRAQAIEKKRPGYKEILSFYKYILREQSKMKPLIKLEPVDMDKEKAQHHLREGFSLIEKKEIPLDMVSAASFFKKMCRGLLRKDEKVAAEAKKISQAVRKKEIDLEELFGRVLDGDRGYLDFIANKAGVHKWLLNFLAESSITPFLEAYADRLKEYVNQDFWRRNTCPVCGSVPVLGVIKNIEGVEGAKFLVCSSCGFGWRFARLGCPYCGNGDHKKLRYFNTEEDGKAYRVDVCEECKKYIKTIDLRVLGMELIPVVDDIGTLHLDMIAEREGYTRGVPGILEIERMEA